MIDLILTIATITLTENGLNIPIKRHRLTNLIKKKSMAYMSFIRNTI